MLIGYSKEREEEFRQYWDKEIRDQRKWTRGMNLFLKPAQRQQNMQLNVDVPHLQDFLNIRVDFLNSKRKIS